MAGTVVFQRAKVEPVLQAVVDRDKPFSIVKSHGVFVAVFGNKSESIETVQCYAEGLDPDGEYSDGYDWYDTARNLLGGDDFVEHIDFKDKAESLLKDKHWGELRIFVTDKHIEVSTL